MKGHTLSHSIVIAAPSERVFDIVSDLPGMGRFSLENRGGSWRRGVDGPALGATFAGRNRQGRLQWSTVATVTDYDPLRQFRFDVTYWRIPVATWSFTIAPCEGGVTLTETWHDNRPPWFAFLTAPIVRDRTAFTTRSIVHTLSQMKAFLES